LKDIFVPHRDLPQRIFIVNSLLKYPRPYYIDNGTKTEAQNKREKIKALILIIDDL
jgi:hypothetical protein